MSKMMQNAKISNFEVKIDSCLIKKVGEIETSKQASSSSTHTVVLKVNVNFKQGLDFYIHF